MLSLLKNGGANGPINSGEDDLEHQQIVRDLLAENTRWLRVVANILADMQDLDEYEIYEGLE